MSSADASSNPASAASLPATEPIPVLEYRFGSTLIVVVLPSRETMLSM